MDVLCLLWSFAPLSPFYFSLSIPVLFALLFLFSPPQPASRDMWIDEIKKNFDLDNPFRTNSLFGNESFFVHQCWSVISLTGAYRHISPKTSVVLKISLLFFCMTSINSMHINTPLSTLDRMKMNKGITLQQRSWQRRHAHPAACDTINVPCREYLLLQCVVKYVLCDSLQ